MPSSRLVSFTMRQMRGSIGRSGTCRASRARLSSAASRPRAAMRAASTGSGAVTAST
ncbi:MAG: hypothetical protein HZT43_17040 [Exiguobacterium profundum]|nr:MAG: hypothetical protein HZT43_17040 [Exiguobacterium profundum]